MQGDVIKDIQVGDAKYALLKMDAFDGSYILSLLVAKLAKMAGEASSEAREGSSDPPPPEALIQLLLINLEEADLRRVQVKALSAVAVYRDEVSTTLPVVRNGAIVIPALKDDVASVTELVRQALFANLAPFFTAAGLEKMLKPASAQ